MTPLSIQGWIYFGASMLANAIRHYFPTGNTENWAAHVLFALSGMAFLLDQHAKAITK